MSAVTGSRLAEDGLGFGPAPSSSSPEWSPVCSGARTWEPSPNPEMTLRDVEIPAGRRISRDVKLPVGKITLVTGGRCVKKPIKIKQKGASDWYKGKFYTCQQMTLMAGEYEAEVGAGRRGTPVSGIQVYDGGIRDVLIRPK